jgi:hypothetical protein
MKPSSYRLKANLLTTTAAAGLLALGLQSSAIAQNTAYGTGALASTTTGADDSAFGFNALNANTLGVGNTATGTAALELNTTGRWNTATGGYALNQNDSGYFNTATGYQALLSNTYGVANTAGGYLALFSNTSGNENTATGSTTLHNNTTGSDNTASGNRALYFNTTGNGNVANGNEALFANRSGNNNTADGDYALSESVTGHNNVAIGRSAGGILTTGSNNIDIGNTGVLPDESDTIRIGTGAVHKRVVIAGIVNSAVVGWPVYVNANGRLGIQPSSIRFKEDVRDMGASSDRIMKLRPVTFRYKSDPSGARQYGLVAEEVESVYPELVMHDEKGRIMGVRYDLLPAILLNQMKRDDARKDARIASLQRQVKIEEQQIQALRKVATRVSELSVRLDVLQQEARRTDRSSLVSYVH